MRNLLCLGRCLAMLALACSGAAHAQRTPIPAKTPAPAKAASQTPGAKPVEELVESVRQSVVVITHFGRDGKEDGVGAGFVISSDGLIATSLHVIGEARPISVQLADGSRREVTEIHAWDRKYDLAIIRIAARSLPALKLGDSDSLKQGAPVIAIGNPLGFKHSVVQGVVSARREVEGIEMLQVAIPIEPGNSGGPLLDLKGRVHGVLALKSAVTPNLGFAMPGKLLQSLLDRPNPVPMERWLTIGALNPRDWKPLFGARWSQKAGRIEVDGEGRGFGGRALCLAQTTVPPRPYEVAVEVRLDDEAGAAGLVFAADGGDRHYGFYPSGGQLRLTRFDGPNVFSWSILKQVPTPHYRSGDWNHLRVRVEAEKISCYVNGELVTESDDEVLREGQAGLAKFRDTRAQFRNFRIGTNLPPASFTTSAALPETLARRLREAGARPDPELLAELREQQAAPALKERARELEREAGALRRLAASLHHQTVQAELVEALKGSEESIDLFHAALLVARLDNPELDIEPYRQQAAAMAREVSATFPAGADDATRLARLREYLFQANGFHGSRSDYHNRANSYLHAVLDDREGLPITLSVLFLELAGRTGIRGVSGLPLPGHFMVRFTLAEGGDQIIDVFNGGKILTRTEAQQHIFETTGEGFRDSDYRPATKREIILRMLRNLLGVAERSQSMPDQKRYLDVLLALAPEGVGDRLQRARLRLQTGDTAGAREDFQWLIDHEPPGVDLERITELLRSL